MPRARKQNILSELRDDLRREYDDLKLLANDSKHLLADIVTAPVRAVKDYNKSPSPKVVARANEQRRPALPRSTGRAKPGMNDIRKTKRQQTLLSPSPAAFDKPGVKTNHDDTIVQTTAYRAGTPTHRKLQPGVDISQAFYRDNPVGEVRNMIAQHQNIDPKDIQFENYDNKGGMKFKFKDGRSVTLTYDQLMRSHDDVDPVVQGENEVAATYATQHKDTQVPNGLDARQLAQYVSSKLVGVEPNPGPRAKKQAVRRNKIATKTSKTVVRASLPAPVALNYSHVQSRKMKKTIIKHCEQVQEVAGSTNTFSLQSNYSLNPGLSTTFPWLSQVCAQYEAYKFKYIRFIYMPYVSSATAGYIAMNCDYNATDSPSSEFTTKQSFCDYDGTTQSNSWEASVFSVRCPNKQGPDNRAIRFGTLSGSYDLNLYDHGTFNLAVGSQTGTANIGTLYVDYAVELYRPRVNYGAVNSGYAHFTSSTSVSATNPLGTSQTTVSNNMGVSISGKVLTFSRVGRYMFIYGLSGAASCTLVANPLTISGTGSIVQNMTTMGDAAAGSITSVGTIITGIIDVNVIGMTVTCNMISTGTGGTMNLYIDQIPSNLSSHRPILDVQIEELQKKVAQLEEKKEEDEMMREKYFTSSSSSSMSSATHTPNLRADWDTLSRTSMGRR